MDIVINCNDNTVDVGEDAHFNCEDPFGFANMLKEIFDQLEKDKPNFYFGVQIYLINETNHKTIGDW